MKRACNSCQRSIAAAVDRTRCLCGFEDEPELTIIRIAGTKIRRCLNRCGCHRVRRIRSKTSRSNDRDVFDTTKWLQLPHNPNTLNSFFDRWMVLSILAARRRQGDRVHRVSPPVEKLLQRRGLAGRFQCTDTRQDTLYAGKRTVDSLPGFSYKQSGISLQL